MVMLEEVRDASINKFDLYSIEEESSKNNNLMSHIYFDNNNKTFEKKDTTNTIKYVAKDSNTKIKEVAINITAEISKDFSKVLKIII